MQTHGQRQARKVNVRIGLLLAAAAAAPFPTKSRSDRGHDVAFKLVWQP